MRVISLKKDQMPAFEHLDPLEVRKEKGFDANLMLGAIRDGGERDVPAGLLLGNAGRKELILRWLFVDPESRRKSFAERLLSEAFLAARDRGLDRLAVTFPDVYGYGSLCRNDRSFFKSHGFREDEDGRMTASISDYVRDAEYNGPSFYDETDMLDRLLALEVEDEEDEVSEYDLEEYFSQIHKPWKVRRAGLREFSKLPPLQKFVKRVLTGKKTITVGCIGDLSFTQFKEGIELCEKKEHTGYLKGLCEIPVDYFDLDVSSYTMTGEKVTGLCLTHFREKEHETIMELLFTVDEDNARSIAELIRFSIVAANAKYPPDTTIVLPAELEMHEAFIRKLFGEQTDNG